MIKREHYVPPKKRNKNKSFVLFKNLFFLIILCVGHPIDKVSKDVTVVGIVNKTTSKTKIGKVSNTTIRNRLRINLIKTVLIAVVRAKLQGILTIKVHSCIESSRLGLLNEGGGLRSTVIVRITHLQAGEIKHLNILAESVCDVLVGIVAVGVVVASGQLSSVRTVIVPPVNTRNLSGKRNLAAKDILGDGENVLTVLKQARLVPGEEESAIIGGVVVETVGGEEASVAGVRVPAASVVGLGVSPLWVTSRTCSLLQFGKKVLVVDLEFTNTAVGPALVLLVARITKLRSRTKTNADTVDGVADLIVESRVEGRHEVLVHLKRSAAVEKSLVINTKVDVFLIRLAVVILVVDVAVGVTNTGDEGRKRDVALITDITTASVEAHDNLEFKTNRFAHRSDVLVGSKVVVLCIGLRKTPPNINHNTLNTHILQSNKILLKLGRIVNTTGGNSSQRKHNIHRNSCTKCGTQ